MDCLQDITITEKEALSLGIIDGLGFVTSEKSAFKKVNAEILEQLKKGNLVFRKPWRDGYKVKGVVYGPHNYVTTHTYRGANAFMIGISNFMNQTDYKQFLTLKQIRERGGKLNSDAKAFPVWAFIKTEKTKTNKKTGKEETTVQKGVIGYVVYPIEHTNNVLPIKRKELKTSENEVNLDADTLIKNMPKLPPIKHGGNQAYYVPSSDYVQMPVQKAFHSTNEYYSTLFHELSHSTGHPKRVGRDLSGRKGNAKYALEELIAELSAAYLCSVCDMPYYTLDNSTAYLKSWGDVLHNEIKTNPNFLLRAVYGATKSAKYIIGTTLEKHGKINTEVKKAGSKKTKKVGAKKSQGLKGISDPLYNFLTSVLNYSNKIVSHENLANLIKTLKNDTKHNPVDSKHPLKEIVNRVQQKIVDVINSLEDNEKVKFIVSNKKEIETKIASLHGLGFWNIIASAIVGKTAEHLTHKHLTRNNPNASLNGFVRADKRDTVEVPGTYKLNGELGKFLGNIQPFKYSIVLTGDTHAGKTEVVIQLVNEFAQINKTVGFFSLEQGGLESKDTQEAVDRNITEKNLQNVFITGEAPKGIDSVKECANQFDVIIIDSWQKLKIPSTKFDDLRHEYPNTIFIVIFQQNGEGGTRGGVSADFDTPVHLKVHKVDTTFVNNYVEMKKNRGNSQTLGLKYMVKAKKTVSI